MRNQTACGARPPELLDGEDSLHSGLTVAGNRAVERVLTGLDRDGDLRLSTVLHDGSDCADPVALERDVVGNGSLVDCDDRQRTSCGSGGRRLIPELSVGVRVDLELAALGDCDRLIQTWDCVGD
jgi:hypothetical protein